MGIPTAYVGACTSDPNPHPELILVALGWQQSIAEFGNPLLPSVGIMLAGSNRVNGGLTLSAKFA